MIYYCRTSIEKSYFFFYFWTLILFNSDFERASSDFNFRAIVTFSSVSLDKYSSSLVVSATISSTQLNSEFYKFSSSCSISFICVPFVYLITLTALAIVCLVYWSKNWYFFIISTMVYVILSNAFTALSLWVIYSSSFSLYILILSESVLFWIAADSFNSIIILSLFFICLIRSALDRWS